MRKAIAMFTMLVIMAIYAVLAASIGSNMTEWPRLAQLAFYVVAGVAWVFPLKPVIDWMNKA